MTGLKVLNANIKRGAHADGRLDPLLDVIAEHAPDIVAFQEANGWPDHDSAIAHRVADRLGMTVVVAPSGTGYHTALAYTGRFSRLEAETERELGYSTSLRLLHGYCGVPLVTPDLPVPLMVISAHLSPYSAHEAAIEAQKLVARAYRYDGIGVLAGDINQPPILATDLGEQEPPWEEVQPYNRSSRCVPRESPDDPWRGDQVVGRVLRDGGLVDVAIHVARQRNDLSLLAPTGKAHLRVDQIHATPALAAGIIDYTLVDTGTGSDHRAILANFDLQAIDASLMRPYS